MRRLEAQVGGRRSSAVCGKYGVGELEEGISPAVEAFVERAAEGAKSIVRFHDGRIMHLPTASRTSYLPAELKRKLRLITRRSQPETVLLLTVSCSRIPRCGITPDSRGSGRREPQVS